MNQINTYAYRYIDLIKRSKYQNTLILWPYHGKCYFNQTKLTYLKQPLWKLRWHHSGTHFLTFPLEGLSDLDYSISIGTKPQTFVPEPASIQYYAKFLYLNQD